MQTIEALKNLAIMGGLLKFYADASSSAQEKSEQFEAGARIARADATT